MTPRTRFGFAALAVTAIGLAAGCSRTIVERPNPTDYDPADTTSDLDFWHTLPGRSAVTNDEGFHGVMQFIEGGDTFRTFDARAAKLKALGWLEADFDEPANMAMQRGLLARLLVHALDVEGGVMLRLTNRSRRYALREVVYQELMGPSTENQAISGLEYIGVMQKAQDYLLLKEVDRRAKEAAAKAEGAGAPGDEKPAEGEAAPRPEPGIGTPG